MKSSSINTLGLALLLCTAPALQANETENSSWLAPFSSNTFLYPAIGIGTGYLLYKLYTIYSEPTELDVIAPWYEDERAIEASIPNESSDIRKIDQLTLDAVNEIVESCISVFINAYGPQLVNLHTELKNPDISDEYRQELENSISALENQAPPFAQTVPPLIIGLSLLSKIQEELVMEANQTTKSILEPELALLVETVAMLNTYIYKYIEIYGNACNADLIAEFSDQLQRELYENAHTNIG